MHDTHEPLRVFCSFGKLKTVMQQEEKERQATFLLPASEEKENTRIHRGEADAHRDTLVQGGFYVIK